MKKLLLLTAIICGAVGLANGQSSQRVSTAIQVGGKDYAVVVPNASIYVCQYNSNLSCTTPVAIFADKTLNQRIPQPLHANSAGVYNYYVPSGTQVVEKVCGAYGQCAFGGVMIGPLGGSGSGSVSSFQVGTWPAWLTPSVTNPTSTPTLSVTASAIPNSALQNNSITLGSTSVALGATASSVAGLTIDGISPTIMGYLSNVTSDIQAQINNKQPSGTYVTTINSVGGAFAFAGPGVSCVPGTPNTCTFGTGLTSPLTTKGDIWGFSTLDARVPVGVDGTVLTADSTQALGVKWGNPVSNINGVSGAFTFVFGSGAGGCASTTCTFNGPTFPPAGIPNSTGSAYGSSYTTSGSGSVVALTNSPTFTTPNIGTATAANLIDLGAAAGSGTNCLQIDSSGNITNTGSACVSPTSGVTSINGTGGAYTFSFSAGAGSCAGTTCTFTGSGTGGGSVTNVTVGNLSPLFTSSVATSTTTPAITFTLSNAAQNSVFAGPASGGAGAPSFQTAPTISAANMTSFPTLNQNTTGYAAGLAGGALGSVPYQSALNTTTFLASPTTSGHTFVLGWTPSGSAIAPSAIDLATYLASPPAIGGTTPAAGNFTTLKATSVAGAGTFCLQINSSGVISNTGSSCVASGGTVTAFSAPTGSWPTWLVPSVTNSTTTPSLSVAAGPIPNSALQNASLTLGSTILTLGASTTSVSGLTVDGVSPTTMGFVDPTSSIQTQLNSKQAALGYTPAHAGANSDITSLSGLTTPLSTAQGGTGATSLSGSFGVSGAVLVCNNASTTTLGCVKVDGTTITASGGVISAVGGGGGGGITQLTGDGTAGPGSGSVPFTLATVNGSPGSCGDSTHVCQITTNGKGLVTTQSAVSIGGIANVQVTTGTTAIGANTCSADLGPVTVTGLATTSTIQFTPTTDTSGSTGWGSTGGLQINPWPTANALHYKICNPTGSSITPSSVTWNVSFK